MLHTTKTHIKLFAKAEAFEAQGPETPDSPRLSEFTKDLLKSREQLLIVNQDDISRFLNSIKKDGKIDMKTLSPSQKSDIQFIDDYLKITNNENIRADQDHIRAKRGLNIETQKQIRDVRTNPTLPTQPVNPAETVEGTPKLTRALRA